MQIVTEDVSTKSKAQHHKLLYCCSLKERRQQIARSSVSKLSQKEPQLLKRNAPLWDPQLRPRVNQLI